MPSLFAGTSIVDQAITIDMKLLISLIAVGVSVLLYLLNRKTFKLLYSKPIIHIIKEVSVKPIGIGDYGGPIGGTFIDFVLFNPSSFGNHISIKLSRFYFLPAFKTGDEDQKPHSEFIDLPPCGKKDIHLRFNYESMSKYKDKWLLLTVTDIKGSKTHKFFRFKEMSADS